MSGIATGTITFTGSNDTGVVADLGVGYLDSGDVLSAKGQGVYWSGDKGAWEVRSTYLLGGQAIVSEGQVSATAGNSR